MFKRKVQINVDIEELEKKIDNLKKAVGETKKKLDTLPITAEMARAISKAKNDELKKEYQPIVDKFLESCYRDIRTKCRRGDLYPNEERIRIMINFSIESKYLYAANEARKELIKMGYQVEMNYDSTQGVLLISW